MKKFIKISNEHTSIKRVRDIAPSEWKGFNKRMENVKIEYCKKEISSVKSADRVVLGR
jgi:hypothetical protein